MWVRTRVCVSVWTLRVGGNIRRAPLDVVVLSYAHFGRGMLLYNDSVLYLRRGSSSVPACARAVSNKTVSTTAHALGLSRYRRGSCGKHVYEARHPHHGGGKEADMVVGELHVSASFTEPVSHPSAAVSGRQQYSWWAPEHVQRTSFTRQFRGLPDRALYS